MSRRPTLPRTFVTQAWLCPESTLKRPREKPGRFSPSPAEKGRPLRPLRLREHSLMERMSSFLKNSPELYF